MRVDAPIGHARQLDGLWRAAREGRLAHALLFCGPAGIGKYLAAESFAAGLLCQRGIGEPCRVCGPCKRFAADSHPDLHALDPVKEELEQIPIKRVVRRDDSDTQTIEEFLGLRAMEGGWRIVLVRESERLNEEAQNALLKTLEEPGRDALLLFECSRVERLLPTILSRVVKVAFDPLPVAEVRGVLEASGVPRETAVAAARIGGGAIGMARRVVDEHWLERRAALVACMSGRASAFEALGVLDAIPGEFAGKTAAAKARNEARATLDLALLLLRDAARLQAGIHADLVPNGDALAGLPRRLAGRDVLERVLAARQDVDLNLAPDAALERMLLALAPDAAELPRKA